MGIGLWELFELRWRSFWALSGAGLATAHQVRCAKPCVDDGCEPIDVSLGGPQPSHQLVEAVPLLVMGSERNLRPPAMARDFGGQIQQAQSGRGNGPSVNSGTVRECSRSNSSNQQFKL